MTNTILFIVQLLFLLKMMTEKYSLLLKPSDEIVSQIRELKNSLRHLIGDYLAYDNEAHLTLCTFLTKREKIEERLKACRAFIDHHLCPPIRMNRLVLYSNKAWVLLPDPDDIEQCVAWMRQFHQQVYFPTLQRNTRPHITIGRQLNEQQCEQVKNLDIQFEVVIDHWNWQLTRYDKSSRQFFIEYNI